MALYNISVDMVVAESAAETEPAWENAGTAVGLQIWRIVVSTHQLNHMYVVTLVSQNRLLRTIQLQLRVFLIGLSAYNCRSTVCPLTSSRRHR